MRKVAAQFYEAKNYAAAEPVLARVLNRSEEKYMLGFLWRDETIKMLAKSCCRIGKFDAANNLFRRSFEGRDELMSTLASESLEAGKKGDAEKIMVQEFKGRENLLESLARSYIQERKWKEAKNVLLNLLKYDAEEKVKCQRIYSLAKSCYSLKHFTAAEEWCLIAVRTAHIVFGERHHQFYESVNLLVQISQAKGDHIEAGAYRAILADLPRGLSGGLGFSVNRLSVECADIEQLCAVLENPKYAKQACKKVGVDYFKAIIHKDTKAEKSIRENIQKAGYKITGTGRGWSLIHTLARCGKELAVQLLLEKGVDLEAPSDMGTPLIVATLYRHLGTVKLLMERGANLEAKNKEGNTAIYIATVNADADCVELLLSQNANPNSKPSGRKRGPAEVPLIHAAVRGYERIAQHLLKYHADPEEQGEYGTALIEATLGGEEGIVKFLLDKGANIHAASPRLGTALHIASRMGYVGIVKLLLGNDADLEARDKNRRTPLMQAAKGEQVEVVELLLKRGAELGATDKDGFTALRLAQRKASSREMTHAVLREVKTTPTIRILEDWRQGHGIHRVERVQGVVEWEYTTRWSTDLRRNSSNMG